MAPPRPAVEATEGATWALQRLERRAWRQRRVRGPQMAAAPLTRTRSSLASRSAAAASRAPLTAAAVDADDLIARVHAAGKDRILLNVSQEETAGLGLQAQLVGSPASLTTSTTARAAVVVVVSPSPPSSPPVILLGRMAW